MLIFFVQIILFYVTLTNGVKLDIIDCGIDHDEEVTVGDLEITKYPWIGILYYIYYGDVGSEARSVTTVVLIQKEFVLAAAADIGPMPKHNFRKNSRVLLGEPWHAIGRRVRNYVLHPEYGEDYTLNTVALVQLKDPVRDPDIKPVCPPPEILRNPIFYVMKFKEDYDVELKKESVAVSHVPGELCKQFYVTANLYSKRMRPPHVACAVSLDVDTPCVWHAGAALVSRDVWGRWMLLGLGVRGPGCGAPSRYLDMASYYPWIETSLDKFRRITISKINKQSYVLRSGENSAYQRFGACDPEEKINLIYREVVKLETDNTQFQFMTYNMTIEQNTEYTCLTLELINASAVSEMRIIHSCPRNLGDKPCHYYKETQFDISVFLMFSDKCLFEMYAWGFPKDMTLLDIQEWKWEEATYYEDFSIKWNEYRGPSVQTDFGYEPIDEKIWTPEYDLWTTTIIPNTTTSTTTSTTTTSRSTSRTKRYFRRKTKTPTTTTTTTTITTTTGDTTTPTTPTPTTATPTTPNPSTAIPTTPNPVTMTEPDQTLAPAVKESRRNFFWRNLPGEVLQLHLTTPSPSQTPPQPTTESESQPEYENIY